MRERYDAVVVGSGPNGLAAAIEVLRAGRSALVVEGQETLGGGCRSMELTLPGFIHDFGSAIHPLGIASPFMRTVPLEEHGVRWIQPVAALAHPLDDGTAAVLEHSIEKTGATLGPDADAWKRLMEPLVRHWEALTGDLLAPFRIPRHPFVLTLTFGRRGLRSVKNLAESWFKGDHARALLAGLGAHSFLPLEQFPTAGFALSLGMLGHAVGWPFPEGGSQKITDGLIAYLQSLGGEVVTGRPVSSIEELPTHQAALFDMTPRQLLAIAGNRFPNGYRRRLEHYRYGPGVFKIDYALNGPIPWKAEGCARAGTVHLGGTLPEVMAGERAVSRGHVPEKPFVLVAQQSLFDPTRAPVGKQTAWAYCHVPNGCEEDMTGRIEAQIERFAPGFRDLVEARNVMTPSDLHAHDANLVGGDINGGLQDLRQLYTRPAIRLDPYSTPVHEIYICSSSTPPGGGVHGMCGYWGARAALGKRVWL